MSLSILLNAGWCFGATSTWNGSISTDWFNSTNWIPAGVPAAGNTINFTNGTTINLTAAVTITGTFNWFSGTMSGKPFTIGSSGLMNISGTVTLNNVLTNAGTVTMTGNAALYVDNNNSTVLGGVYNLASGLWDNQTNASIYNGGYGFEFFNNTGTYRKSAGSGSASIFVPFANNGTVTNLTGTMSFTGGGVITGTYGTAAGATIAFGGGNFTMGALPLITGLGLCEFTGLSLTLTQNWPTNLALVNGNVILGPAFQGGAITNLTLNGADLVSTNRVAGTFNWLSGTIGGPLTVASGGVLNITGGDSLNNVLTNAGTVNLTGNAALYVNNNNSSVLGGVYNVASGLWDNQTNAPIYDGAYGFEFFNNAGTLRKSGGAGSAVIYVPFTNTSLVTNLIGTLSFNGGGVLTGTYGTAAGATTYFAAGNFTMGALPLITGLGLCEFTGTTLTLTQNWPTNLPLASGNVILGPTFQGGAITNLTLNGATVVSTNKVTGTFNWVSGTIGGPLTVASGGVLNISGGVSLNNILTNAGTVNLISNAAVYIDNNNSTVLGGVYNLASGLWDNQTNAPIYDGGYGFEFFNNAGTFRKSAGSGAAAIYVPFTNTSLVTNAMGTVNFDGGGVLTGTYGTAAGATTYFAAGNFTMGTPPLITGLGLCEFLGATLTLTQNVPANLVLAGGNVFLGPAFQGGAVTNLTLNGATVVSTNRVTGTFNWVTGTIGGPLTVAGGGVLNISGSVSLNNMLTNAGTVNLIGNAALYVDNNNSTVLGGVYNLASGLWDIQTNASIYDGGYGFEFFNNAGTLRKSGSPGTATVYVPFSNSGTVTNFLGTLGFGNGGTLAGAYGTAAGATTEFIGGNFTMGPLPLITGTGLCEFVGTTLTLMQNWPANLVLAGGNVILGPAFQSGGAVTNLTLNGATLVSTNKVTGTLNWASGTISGPLTVASGGVLNIGGSVSLNNILTNAGTVNLIGSAALYVDNNNSTVLGGVYNLASGLWDIQTNASIYDGGYGFEFFNNAGTLRKSGGPGTSGIYVPFTNTGTVNALVGILSFGGSFTTSGGTLAFGVSGLANLGQITVSGSVALNGTASVTWLGGFTPNVGNVFTLLNYGSQSGTFSNIILPPGSSGAPTYGATAFSLMITNTTTQTNVPVFLNIKLVNSNTVVVSWPSSATNYTLQTNASLSPATWGNVSSGIVKVGPNNVLSNTPTGKGDFFRLRSP